MTVLLDACIRPGKGQCPVIDRHSGTPNESVGDTAIITIQDNTGDRGETWARWLHTHASRLGFVDTHAIAIAGKLPVEELLDWGAGEHRVQPAVPAVLRIAALLQVDPYDLLVAAGWVYAARTEQPMVHRDDRGATFTWPSDPPRSVS